MIIRTATTQDAKALVDIYSYYVLNTAITFEYDVPSVEEFEKRIAHTLQNYPYLVAIQNDEIVGYAYASPLKERAAYQYCVETSIYTKKDAHKQGIGKALYNELEKELIAQGIQSMYACITYPEVEDEYLTKNSVQFHEHLGYKQVGLFPQCGYKFNRYYNVMWMEKNVSPHISNALPFKPYKH